MSRKAKDLNAKKENDLNSKKPHDCIIAFDNGVTGAVAICNTDNLLSFNLSKDYTKKELSYTKIKKNITRIDASKLQSLIKEAVLTAENPIAVIERPMVNPTRFVASCSALRALEATLIVLESFHIPVVYCDSKEWQHKLFGKSPIGDTKENSKKLGLELYPQFADKINKQDADALLILHWFKQKERV